ncbi:MAG: pyridoxal-dependent decarboxylase [Pseudomonadota bacterium]
MDWDAFETYAKRIASWAAEYHRSLGERPVRAQTAPGAIAAQIGDRAPETREDMDTILADFERIVMPGMTHWQHPRFFAYFPANAAPPSILAELLVTSMAAQCMLWQTSPAATELEGRMVEWLATALGLDGMTGVIQDSASSATLSAVLTMRERATGFTGNRDGLNGKGALRIYCSEECHSSIDRAAWVSGIGQTNLVKLPTRGPTYAMNVDALEAAIEGDRSAGHTPAGIVAITGGTGIGASDDLDAIADVAARAGLYTHLDAAWAGSAMIAEDLRSPIWDGAQRFDSVVFNPHKWLGAQFDCSVQFLRDPGPQLDTLRIEPEYLRTSAEVTNYSEWTIPLGRRFRALKLWFLLRAYGLEDLRGRMRNHCIWAREASEALRAAGFEIVTEPQLSLFTFRCTGDDSTQQALVDRINDDGRIYLTQGAFRDRKVVRFQVGQFHTTREDVALAVRVITELAS